jgi:hypothetical protein
MKTGTADEIILEVRKSVEQHQCSQQRHRQLKLNLSQKDPLLVGDALLQYWLTLYDPGSQFNAQQFVASLLFALNPPTSLSLPEILVGLPSWNLSIEKFPWYLALQFGKEQVLHAVRGFERTAPDPTLIVRAAEAFRYWLGMDYLTAHAQVR